MGKMIIPYSTHYAHEYNIISGKCLEMTTHYNENVITFLSILQLK